MAAGLVSIVIVNWNRKDDLRECIESILNQKYKDIEIIVVDNHSHDGSIEMIRNEFQNVKLITMPDSSYGACETFNIGFANAMGEYVVIMDNDAILENDWIEKAIKYFKNDAKLGCIAGRVLNYYTKEDWGFWVYGLDDNWKNKRFNTTVFVGCGAIVLKKVLYEVEGYPNEYFIFHNEFALGAKIINAGYNIEYSPDLIAHHKVSKLQRPGKRQLYYLVRNWYLFIWRYYPVRLAVKHTLIHLIKSSYSGCRNLLTYLRANFDALKELPNILRKREPIKNVSVLKPKSW